MSEHEETAPPWSGKWLVPPKGEIEQNAGDKAFPTSHGGTVRGSTREGGPEKNVRDTEVL